MLSYSLWTPFFFTTSGGTWKYAKAPSTKKKNWRDSLPIDILLSAVSVLVVAHSSSEIPEGLMNNPVFIYDFVAHWPRDHPQQAVIRHSVVNSSPLLKSPDTEQSKSVNLARN